MKALKFLMRYVKRYGLSYVLGILALLMVDAVNVYIPQYTGEITDGLEAGLMSLEGVLGLVGKILLMGGLITIGRFGWRYFLFGSARSIERDLRDDLFAHLTTLSTRYFNENKTGDLMAHFTNDLGSVRMLVGNTVITSFDASVMLILVLAKMVTYVDPRLTAVAVIPLLLITFGHIFYGKMMHKRFLGKQEAFSLLTDQVQESVSGIRVIKAFVQERKELRAFAKVNQNAKDKNLSVVRLIALVMPLMDLVIGASSLLTLLYGGYLAIHGEITVGQFIAFNSYIGMLVWPMIAVGDCITSISQGMASLGRIVKIFDQKAEIVDGPKARDIKRLHGGIELRNLSFAYPDAPTVPVLTDVSVTVKPGETLAVLGRTGSGKSTLPSLLLRMHEAQEGMILMDGHTMPEIPLAVLRRDIAYVPQDNFLFSDTLARNIAFGVDGARQKDIEEATIAACIHESIVEFPEKYETIVGERGVTLSGGQKQRSSIARALMKDAPILILDDALSAVDTDTERQILQNLKAYREDRTTIIIAHRISTIQDADHILVLDEGRAVEYGTHEELLAMNGLYRSIHDKQQLEKQLHEEGGEHHA